MKDNLIDYWSYSSMTQLMRNPLAFKKKYVLKVYDDQANPSGVVGSACHKALESYYGGKEQHEAIEEGLRYIDNISDSEINYGKTGSRENILESYTQAINFYFEELPEFHEIIGVEYGITTPIETVKGEKLGLPAKSFSDLITRNKLGEIEVIDHKFVKSYTDGDIDDFSKFLQGMFLYHTVKAKFGEAPKRVIFNECKVSRNRDNTPQIQPYVIDFEDARYGDFATFYKLYDACTEFISNPKAIFLPNPNDIFDGQNSFETFRMGVIGVDRPVSVAHKTEQKTFVEKNYVASAFDKVENENLTPESRIAMKLQEFAIPVKMDKTHVGASVTQYTFKPSRGVSMAKISKLGNDLALALEADRVRIEAPIRGTNLVGVEVPSTVRKRIDFSDKYLSKGTMKIPIGLNVYGEMIYKDLADMPHLLIAGATGSGKSVMLNVLLTALTKQMSPDKLKLILVDPKRVELTGFSKVPHLEMPVVYEDVEAEEVLKYAVNLMEDRYAILSNAGVRNIDDYKGDMPKLVIVIDEFADLMMTKGEGSTTERNIVRIAQKARAVGIHLILATQRPSAEVVTGLIKANIPTKIAFSTTTAINSKIILDQSGAEELTGKGDMLFLDPSSRDLLRLQGLYI